MLSRRQILKIMGTAMGGAALGGCRMSDLIPTYSQLDEWPAEMEETCWRVLNRITFGPRPAERQRAAAIGPAAFIEEQLAPDSLPEMDRRPWLALRRLETVDFDASDLFDIDEAVVKQELQQASLLRAVYSPRQLHELMVDFWSNHFSIDQNKEDCAWLKSVDDREVIRPHALGNFYDLLSASVHSPAMLVYLDNQENHAGDPNENYARELLELHTLGVNSSYTQTDIQELARCLTGWTVKDFFYRGEFTFAENQHDDGAKTVLGLALPAGSKQAGGEQIIEMLATHPDTAYTIATKLARRFVADEPPPGLVAGAAQTFLNTHGDIKAVLRTVLLSPEMLNPERSAAGRKLKRPLDYVAGALRQLNVKTDAGPPLHRFLAQMGQPLFQWPTPDGFPDRAEAWSGSLMTRWRFALALTRNEISGSVLDWEELSRQTGEAELSRSGRQQWATLLLGRPLPPALTDRLWGKAKLSDERVLVATLLGSPAYQWR